MIEFQGRRARGLFDGFGGIDGGGGARKREGAKERERGCGYEGDYMFWEVGEGGGEEERGGGGCDTVARGRTHATTGESREGRGGCDDLNAIGASDEERGRCATLIRARKCLLLV